MEEFEYVFADGTTVQVNKGEDGYHVHLYKEGEEPLMGTYTDFKKMVWDIGENFLWWRGLNNEYDKLAIKLRRLNPKYTRIDIYCWLCGED